MYGDTKNKKDRIGDIKKKVAKRMHKSFKMTKYHNRKEEKSSTIDGVLGKHDRNWNEKNEMMNSKTEDNRF